MKILEMPELPTALAGDDDLIADRWAEIVAALTRRQLLGGSAAAAAGMGLASCSNSPAPTSAGPWTFTDDLGVVITREALPKRIITDCTHAVALADLGLGERIVGLLVKEAGIALESPNLDLASIPGVGGTGYDGQVELEKLAALTPDLIVASSWGTARTFNFLDNQVAAQVQKIAPIWGIKYNDVPLESILDSTERLASALGAPALDLTQAREVLAGAVART